MHIDNRIEHTKKQTAIEFLVLTSLREYSVDGTLMNQSRKERTKEVTITMICDSSRVNVRLETSVMTRRKSQVKSYSKSGTHDLSAGYNC